MKLSHITSITTFKANASEMLRTIADTHEPIIITQNGEAQAVVVDVVSYQETQQTLALLKILALGEEEFNRGDYISTEEAFRKIRSGKSPI